MTVSALAEGRVWPLAKTAAGHNRFYERPGKPQGFIVHHAAITSDASLKAQYVSPARELSSNYAMTRAGDIVAILHEEYRPFTSSSAKADNWGITIEIANESAAPNWKISDRAFDQLARLIADCATRWDFPINRSTVIGHREVLGKFGQGIATACPGPWLFSRMDELVALARKYQQNGVPAAADQGGLTVNDIDTINKRLDALAKEAKDAKFAAEWCKQRLAGSVLSGKSITELLGEAAKPSIDPEQIADAITAEVGDDVARQILDALGKRISNG